VNDLAYGIQDIVVKRSGHGVRAMPVIQDEIYSSALVILWRCNVTDVIDVVVVWRFR
jgi:hypothetical protein